MRISTSRWSPLEAALASLGHKIAPLREAASSDVLWCSKSTRHVMSPELIDEARRSNGKLKVVMWDGDVRRIPANHVTSLGERIDLLLVGHENAAQANLLRSVGVKRVSTFYHGVTVSDFPAPRLTGNGLFLGGNNYLGRDDEYPGSRGRYDLVEAVVAAGFDLFLAGLYWAVEAMAPVNDAKAYCAVMQKSVATLGYNHFDLERYYTKRLFDSLAAGRLHLTKYIPGMEMDFRNHEHLVWFRDIDEALDLAGWYVKNDGAREKVAASGRALVLGAHRFWDRAMKLSSILEEVVNEA